MKRILLATSIFLLPILLQAQIDKTTMVKAIQQYNNASSLSINDFSNFAITSQYTESKTGITHIYIRQTIDNIEVFNANSSLHFDKSGNLFHFNNAFIQNAKDKISSTNISIDANNATQSVAGSIGISVRQKAVLS